jgi:hypothetical protein
MSPARKTLSWRDVLPVHPAAELFPRMSEEELDALAKDIQKYGLTSPIVIGHWDKYDPKFKLWDGRNRLDALEAAGLLECSPSESGPDFSFETPTGRRLVPVKVLRECDGHDPYAYVISANIQRRHLTPEQKREIIAKVIEADPTRSDRQIAGMVKRDHKTVAGVRAEMEDVGRIPHVKTRTDTKGRKQPSRRPRKPESTEAPTSSPSPTQEAVKPAAGSPPSVIDALAVMIEHAATCEYGRREAEALLAANPRYGSDAVNKLVGWLRDLAGDLKKIEVYERAEARAKAKPAAKGKGGAS